jgi:hypothetical protein
MKMFRHLGLVGISFIGSIVPAWYSHKQRLLIFNERRNSSLEQIKQTLKTECTVDRYLRSNEKWKERTGSNVAWSDSWGDLTNCVSTAHAMLDIIPQKFYFKSERHMGKADNTSPIQVSHWRHRDISEWLANGNDTQ